ncbi:hypothetical protein BDW59DRAFT_178837 [Aspergillus cavernicola]|uniref:Uncharacterized protein n=1 Tax=Aspergillus cavernicola TaxID=176166 RepID=A0ABR4IL15_9EURO
MPSNKDRLYVALYAREEEPSMPGDEDTYHWAFIIGPKMRARWDEWHFQEQECPLIPTSMLLVRVMIGKVKDGHRLAEVMRNTAIRQNETGWNCVFWVKVHWKGSKLMARPWGQASFVGKRSAERQWDIASERRISIALTARETSDMSQAPTYDLIKRKELVL